MPNDDKSCFYICVDKDMLGTCNVFIFCAFVSQAVCLFVVFIVCIVLLSFIVCKARGVCICMKCAIQIKWN